MESIHVGTTPLKCKLQKSKIYLVGVTLIFTFAENSGVDKWSIMPGQGCMGFVKSLQEFSTLQSQKIAHD